MNLKTPKTFKILSEDDLSQVVGGNRDFWIDLKNFFKNAQKDRKAR
ncbi:bacteriocin [Streptococcus pluranimalium]